MASSLDGRTALLDGQSQWITGAEARADGHRMRARAGAVITGVGTVLKDDPQMTVRAVDTPRQPLRVVVDRHGDTPASARVLAGGGALLVTSAVPTGRVLPAGVEVLDLPDADGRVDLAAMLRALGKRGINEVHVEAGARLTGAMLDAGLVDEWVLYLAPSLIGDPARGIVTRREPLAELSARTQLAVHSVERMGGDVRIIARRI
jgi:diaminohydroxyphosphoribosylaminopyrimidine deaminase/5-amino-6-(5-phosphoribosylamino)uracil reductase